MPSFEEVESDLEAHIRSHADTPAAIQVYVDACRQRFGETSKEFALRMANVGRLYYELSRFDEALPFYQTAESCFTALDPNSYDAAIAISNTASAYWKLGSSKEARARSEKALAIFRRLPKTYRPMLAQMFMNCACAARDIGEFTDSENAFKGAFDILQEMSQMKSGLAALCYENLGRLQMVEGRTAEAEISLVSAVGIFSAYGNGSQCRALGDLATLYISINDLTQAKRYAHLALDAGKQSASAEDLAALFDNYGVILAHCGEFPAAEDAERSALEIREKAMGEFSADAAISWLNLANLYMQQNRHEEMGAALMKAREISKRQPEKNELLDFTIQVDTAIDLRLNGKFGEALSLIDDLLARMPAHPELGPQRRIRCLRLRAFLLIDTNDVRAAAHAATAYTDAVKTELENTLATGTEQQRLSLLFSEELQRPFDLWDNLGDARMMANCVLQFKSLTLDLLIARNRRSATPQRQQMFALEAKVNQLTERLSSVSNERQDELLKSINQTKIDLAALRAADEGISAEQHTLRAAFGTNAAQVSKCLPPDGALLEFVRFGRNVHGRATFAYGCVVVLANGDAHWVSFPETAEVIDGLVNRFATAARGAGDTEDDLHASLSELYRVLWLPLKEKIPITTRTIITCADGSLHKLAFPCLLDPAAEQNGKSPFLASKFDTVTAVMTGRDLLQDYHPPVGKEALLVADPDFDAVVGSTPAVGSPMRQQKEVNFPMPLSARRQLYRHSFERLGATLEESKAVSTVLNLAGWSKIVELAGKKATEANVRQSTAVDLILIATHGVFLEHGNDSNKLPGPELIPSEFEPQSDSSMQETMFCLAGFGSTKKVWQQGKLIDSSDDGIMTAAEVSTLPFHDRWLVTLSACDVGHGTAVPGEGVLGMQRAFAGIGTNNVMLTLWNVPSRYTQKFMAAFFERVLESDDPPRTLATLQREQLEELSHTSLLDAIHDAGPFVLVFRGKMKP